MPTTRAETPHQSLSEPDRIIAYKKLPNRDLFLHVFDAESEAPAPGILLLHSGGWSKNGPESYYRIARALQDMGFTVACAEYRLILQKDEPATTVFDAVEDARDAFRFLHTEAAKLNIDPERISAGGGSAGGHLAAGIAFFKGDKVAASPVPQPKGLILLNPVIDTSKKGYGNGRIGPDWEKISPVHQVRRGAPPTIVFHGTADRTTPYRGAKLFDEAMRAAGNICELYSHEGGDHGYYREDVIFDATMELIRDFSNRHNLL